MLLNENITEKDLETVQFWLTNILRSLSEENMQELTRAIGKRCGVDVITKTNLAKPEAVLPLLAADRIDAASDEEKWRAEFSLIMDAIWYFRDVDLKRVDYDSIRRFIVERAAKTTTD